jgi:PAS domain S-box-containing protein
VIAPIMTETGGPPAADHLLAVRRLQSLDAAMLRTRITCDSYDTAYFDPFGMDDRSARRCSVSPEAGGGHATPATRCSLDEAEQLNTELERRVAERTAELEASTSRLLHSEQRRSLALAAGQMGSWQWDPLTGRFQWDDGQYRIFGVDPETFDVTIENVRRLVHPDDWKHLQNTIKPATPNTPSFQSEFRVCRPNGELRWCIGTAVATVDATDHVVRITGVTVDITDRKEAEERQALLAREVDHRARNALALVQSIVRLTRADNIKSYIAAVEGRIAALSRAHTLLAHSRWQGADLARLVDEELAAYRMGDAERIAASGPDVSLDPRVSVPAASALPTTSDDCWT